MSDMPAYQLPIHERLDRDYDFSDASVGQHQTAAVVRERFLALAHEMADTCPSSRERSMAFNKLQEAKMWFVQSVYTGVDADG